MNATSIHLYILLINSCIKHVNKNGGQVGDGEQRRDEHSSPLALNPLLQCHGIMQ